MAQSSVKDTTGYVNYVYNISARGTAQVASQLMGLSGIAGNILGQLAFQTSSYLSSTESAMLSIGTVGTAGFLKATQKALDFNQALATIGAISGKTTSEVGSLGDKAMDMSAKFGVAVGDMTEGLESLARAGVSQGNMEGILYQAMGLSKLEGLTLNQSINDLISTTNLLDTEGLDLESSEYVEAVKRRNQQITATSEAAPINAQDIIHTLEHVGGYASSANIDQDDLFAVIAQLGSKGTKSEIAGTSLRAFLAAGQKDTAQRALNRIGLSVKDLWKDDETMMSITDMKDVLDEAMESRGYTKQEKLEFYSDFAGYKQANQIMKIDTTSAREFKEKIDQSWDMSKKIEQITGTAKTNLQGLMQAGMNFLTNVGTPLLHIISPIAAIMKTTINLIDAIPGSNLIVSAGLVLVSLKTISLIFNKIVPQLVVAKGNTGIMGKFFSGIKEDLNESYTILKNINNLDVLQERANESLINNVTDQHIVDYVRQELKYKNASDIDEVRYIASKDEKVDKILKDPKKQVVRDWRKDQIMTLKRVDDEVKREEENKKKKKKGDFTQSYIDAITGLNAAIIGLPKKLESQFLKNFKFKIDTSGIEEEISKLGSSFDISIDTSSFSQTLEKIKTDIHNVAEKFKKNLEVSVLESVCCDNLVKKPIVKQAEKQRKNTKTSVNNISNQEPQSEKKSSTIKTSNINDDFVTAKELKDQESTGNNFVTAKELKDRTTTSGQKHARMVLTIGGSVSEKDIKTKKLKDLKDRPEDIIIIQEKDNKKDPAAIGIASKKDNRIISRGARKQKILEGVNGISAMETAELIDFNKPYKINKLDIDADKNGRIGTLDIRGEFNDNFMGGKKFLEHYFKYNRAMQGLQEGTRKAIRLHNQGNKNEATQILQNMKNKNDDTKFIEAMMADSVDAPINLTKDMLSNIAKNKKSRFSNLASILLDKSYFKKKEERKKTFYEIALEREKEKKYEEALRQLDVARGTDINPPFDMRLDEARILNKQGKFKEVLDILDTLKRGNLHDIRPKEFNKQLQIAQNGLKQSSGNVQNFLEFDQVDMMNAMNDINSTPMGINMGDTFNRELNKELNIQTGAGPQGIINKEDQIRKFVKTAFLNKLEEIEDEFNKNNDPNSKNIIKSLISEDVIALSELGVDKYLGREETGKQEGNLFLPLLKEKKDIFIPTDENVNTALGYFYNNIDNIMDFYQSSAAVIKKIDKQKSPKKMGGDLLHILQFLQIYKNNNIEDVIKASALVGENLNEEDLKNFATLLPTNTAIKVNAFPQNKEDQQEILNKQTIYHGQSSDQIKSRLQELTTMIENGTVQDNLNNFDYIDIKLLLEEYRKRIDILKEKREKIGFIESLKIDEQIQDYQEIQRNLYKISDDISSIISVSVPGKVKGLDYSRNLKKADIDAGTRAILDTLNFNFDDNSTGNAIMESFVAYLRDTISNMLLNDNVGIQYDSSEAAINGIKAAITHISHKAETPLFSHVMLNRDAEDHKKRRIIYDEDLKYKQESGLTKLHGDLAIEGQIRRETEAADLLRAKRNIGKSRFDVEKFKTFEKYDNAIKTAERKIEREEKLNPLREQKRNILLEKLSTKNLTLEQEQDIKQRLSNIEFHIGRSPQIIEEQQQAIKEKADKRAKTLEEMVNIPRIKNENSQDYYDRIKGEFGSITQRSDYSSTQLLNILKYFTSLRDEDFAKSLPKGTMLKFTELTAPFTASNMNDIYDQVSKRLRIFDELKEVPGLVEHLKYDNIAQAIEFASMDKKLDVDQNPLIADGYNFLGSFFQSTRVNQAGQKDNIGEMAADTIGTIMGVAFEDGESRIGKYRLIMKKQKEFVDLKDKLIKDGMKEEEALEFLQARGYVTNFNKALDQVLKVYDGRANVLSYLFLHEMNDEQRLDFIKRKQQQGIQLRGIGEIEENGETYEQVINPVLTMLDYANEYGNIDNEDDLKYIAEKFNILYTTQSKISQKTFDDGKVAYGHFKSSVNTTKNFDNDAAEQFLLSGSGMKGDRGLEYYVRHLAQAYVSLAIHKEAEDLKKELDKNKKIEKEYSYDEVLQILSLYSNFAALPNYFFKEIQGKYKPNSDLGDIITNAVQNKVDRSYGRREKIIGVSKGLLSDKNENLEKRLEQYKKLLELDLGEEARRLLIDVIKKKGVTGQPYKDNNRRITLLGDDMNLPEGERIIDPYTKLPMGLSGRKELMPKKRNKQDPGKDIFKKTYDEYGNFLGWGLQGFEYNSKGDNAEREDFALIAKRVWGESKIDRDFLYAAFAAQMHLTEEDIYNSATENQKERAKKLYEEMQSNIWGMKFINIHQFEKEYGEEALIDLATLMNTSNKMEMGENGEWGEYGNAFSVKLTPKEFEERKEKGLILPDYLDRFQIESKGKMKWDEDNNPYYKVLDLKKIQLSEEEALKTILAADITKKYQIDDAMAELENLNDDQIIQKIKENSFTNSLQNIIEAIYINKEDLYKQLKPILFNTSNNQNVVNITDDQKRLDVEEKEMMEHYLDNIHGANQASHRAEYGEKEYDDNNQRVMGDSYYIKDIRARKYEEYAQKIRDATNLSDDEKETILKNLYNATTNISDDPKSYIDQYALEDSLDPNDPNNSIYGLKNGINMPDFEHTIGELLVAGIKNGEVDSETKKKIDLIFGKDSENGVKIGNQLILEGSVTEDIRSRVKDSEITIESLEATKNQIENIQSLFDKNTDKIEDHRYDTAEKLMNAYPKTKKQREREEEFDEEAVKKDLDFLEEERVKYENARTIWSYDGNMEGGNGGSDNGDDDEEEGGEEPLIPTLEFLQSMNMPNNEDTETIKETVMKNTKTSGCCDLLFGVLKNIDNTVGDIYTLLSIPQIQYKETKKQDEDKQEENTPLKKRKSKNNEDNSTNEEESASTAESNKQKADDWLNRQKNKFYDSKTMSFIDKIKEKLKPISEKLNDTSKNEVVAKSITDKAKMVEGLKDDMQYAEDILDGLSHYFAPIGALSVTMQAAKGMVGKVQDGMEGVSKFLILGKTLSEGKGGEFFGKQISPESIYGKMIIKSSSLLAQSFELLIPVVEGLLGPLAILGVSIFAITKILNWSHKAHEKNIKKLEEEQKENRSRVRSLKTQAEQSRDLARKNRNNVRQQFFDDKYKTAQTKLDTANMRRQNTAIQYAREENDSLWGTYGLSAAIDKIRGNYESTANDYEGTTKQIRQIKEGTLGNIFATPAMRQVSAYYDANKFSFAMIDEYKDELGQLYDTETRIKRRIGPDKDPRQTQEWQKAIDKFVEATGITRDHAEQYLNYMQIEHNVGQAEQAMRAQAEQAAASTEMKVQAIAFGGNPADILGLNGIEKQQEVMIQAQADIIKQEVAGQLWWKAVWATITAPFKLIVAPLLAIIDILAAMWQFITGNPNGARMMMKNASSHFNALSEASMYWSGWAEIQGMSLDKTGENAVDKDSRARYGDKEGAGGISSNGFMSESPSAVNNGRFMPKDAPAIQKGKEEPERPDNSVNPLTMMLGTVTGVIASGALIAGLIIGLRKFFQSHMFEKIKNVIFNSVEKGEVGGIWQSKVGRFFNLDPLKDLFGYTKDTPLGKAGSKAKNVMSKIFDPIKKFFFGEGYLSDEEKEDLKREYGVEGKSSKEIIDDLKEKGKWEEAKVRLEQQRAQQAEEDETRKAEENAKKKVTTKELLINIRDAVEAIRDYIIGENEDIQKDTLKHERAATIREQHNDHEQIKQIEGNVKNQNELVKIWSSEASGVVSGNTTVSDAVKNGVTSSISYLGDKIMTNTTDIIGPYNGGINPSGEIFKQGAEDITEAFLLDKLDVKNSTTGSTIKDIGKNFIQDEGGSIGDFVTDMAGYWAMGKLGGLIKKVAGSGIFKKIKQWGLGKISSFLAKRGIALDLFNSGTILGDAGIFGAEEGAVVAGGEVATEGGILASLDLEGGAAAVATPLAALAAIALAIPGMMEGGQNLASDFGIGPNRFHKGGILNSLSKLSFSGGIMDTLGISDWLGVKGSTVVGLSGIPIIGPILSNFASIFMNENGTSIFSNWFNGLGAKWDQFKAYGLPFLSGVTMGQGDDIFTGIWNWLSAAPGNVSEWFKNAPQNVVDWGASALSSILGTDGEDILNMIDSGVEWITSAPDNIGNWLTDTGNSIWNWGSGAVDSAGNFINSLFGSDNANNASKTVKGTTEGIDKASAATSVNKKKKEIKDYDKKKKEKSQKAKQKAKQKDKKKDKKQKDKKEVKNDNSNSGNITIENININTTDDPESIKAMFIEAIIELQEQINPRQVSRQINKSE